MLEFIMAFVATLPKLPDEWSEYGWKMDDGGTIQAIVHQYNKGVTDPSKYVYHDGWYLYEEDFNLDFSGFDWKNFRQSEREVLQPQLSKLGFTDIKWMSGESDSFGPLTRSAGMTDVNDKRITFVYG